MQVINEIEVMDINSTFQEINVSLLFVFPFYYLDYFELALVNRNTVTAYEEAQPYTLSSVSHFLA